MKKVSKKKGNNGWIITISTIIFFVAFGFFFKGGISADFFIGGLTQKYILSKDIYLGSEELNKTYVVYDATVNVNNVKFTSTCDVSSEVKENNGTLYMFEIKFNDSNCKDGNIVVKSNSGVYDKFELNLISDYSLYNTYIDYNSQDLSTISNYINSTITKFSVYLNYNGSFLMDENNYYEKIRYYHEMAYLDEVMTTIIQKRFKKYLIPVVGYNLPSQNNSKMPNTGRPYRSSITDGIHHSWDIDAPYGTEVVSLDDGIIVRVVDGFEDSNYDKIKTKDVTDFDKAKNLDIYRGNQIWIKTMKGEIVMYAHLSEIVDGLAEGDMVKRGQYLGNIGATGVPEEGYSDFHLDFGIYENPNYDPTKAGTYTIDDYLVWPWKYQGETVNYIIEHQYELFERTDEEEEVYEEVEEVENIENENNSNENEIIDE